MRTTVFLKEKKEDFIEKEEFKKQVDLTICKIENICRNIIEKK